MCPAPPRGTSTHAPLLQRLARDERGVAAIEFALLFPILLLIVAASVDISEALYARGKATHLAASMAGFVADQKQWKASEVDDLLKGGAFIMTPYETDGLQIVVSVLSIGANGTVKVSSSRAYGTAALKPGTASPVAVPTAILDPGVDIVFAQVDYIVRTPFSQLWPTIGIRKQFDLSLYAFARPRRSDKVTVE